MKLLTFFTIGLVISGNIALACPGGNEARLQSDGKDFAILDKSTQKLKLASGVSLHHIGDCKVDNIDADLSARVIDLTSFYEDELDLCIGLTNSESKSYFRIPITELKSISRSLGCGTTIPAEFALDRPQAERLEFSPGDQIIPNSGWWDYINDPRTILYNASPAVEINAGPDLIK